MLVDCIDERAQLGLWIHGILNGIVGKHPFLNRI